MRRSTPSCPTLRRPQRRRLPRPRALCVLACLCLALGLDATPLCAQAETIRVRGSDTLLPLVRAWATEYMASHPGVSVRAEGGGSTRGLRALIEGDVDIASASRPMEPEEARRILERHGSLGYSTLVARDALSVYVHPDNPVRSLDLEQLGRVFRGEVERWSAVGGLDLGIERVNRNAASGTRAFFAERVLRGRDYGRAQTAVTNAEVVRRVARDPAAVGYGGLAAADASVVALRIEGVAPTEENVRDGSYPISRYLYLYTAEPPRGAIQEFLTWVVSDEGQAVVRKSGYVPLRAVDPQSQP